MVTLAHNGEGKEERKLKIGRPKRSNPLWISVLGTGLAGAAITAGLFIMVEIITVNLSQAQRDLTEFHLPGAIVILAGFIAGALITAISYYLNRK